jgi:hypothetical protein
MSRDTRLANDRTITSAIGPSIPKQESTRIRT